MQDVSVTRYADGQSALFFDAVARGQHLPTVVLVDGLMTITLTDVLVSSYSTGGFADGKDPKQASPSENITFNFAKITYTVNGATKCFNIPTNTSC